MDRVELYDDGIGYVSLVDTMGDEFTPAEDARLSTGKGRLGPEKDAHLQERLIRDNHTSPFEGVILKFEIRAPLFVLREIDRHRTLDKIGDEDVEVVTPEEDGRKWFSRNEMSGRYVQMPNEYYYPQIVRGQSRTNAQGDANATEVDETVQALFIGKCKMVTAMARSLYDYAVNNGIERGLARICNTQNQYTKIRLTGSLKNWFDFLVLRLPADVLEECRWLAEGIFSIIMERYPDPVTKWKNHVLDSVRFTGEEMIALRNVLDGFYQGESCENVVLDKIMKKLGL